MADRHRKFVCLYSGLLQELLFLEGPDRHGWSLIGGFDPSLPFLSAEEGEAAFRMRMGKPDGVERASCPYTGAPVEFHYDHGLWWPKGDFFNPYHSWVRKDELLYRASFRSGRTKRKPPEPSVVRSVEDREELSDPTEDLDGGKCIQDMIEEKL